MSRKIKILSMEYEVKEVDNIEHGSDEIGRIQHLDNLILIKRGINEERKKVVLIHEIIHAIFEQLGFSEEHDNEHLINSLANSIYQVFTSNKDLI